MNLFREMPIFLAILQTSRFREGFTLTLNSEILEGLLMGKVYPQCPHSVKRHLWIPAQPAPGRVAPSR